MDKHNSNSYLGANTRESQRNIAVQSAESAILSAKGISYPNALNLPIRESDIPDEIKPYFELTQKMGNISAQATREKVEKIKVITEGEISKYIDSITTFAVVGTLKESLEDSVTYVNAEFIADDMGITIEREESLNRSGFANRVTIILTKQKLGRPFRN